MGGGQGLTEALPPAHPSPRPTSPRTVLLCSDVEGGSVEGRMASSVIAFSTQVLVSPHCWDVNNRQTTHKEGLSLAYGLGGCSPSQSRRGIRCEREGEERGANSIVEFSSPLCSVRNPSPRKGVTHIQSG